jgi:multifunctional cyclase/dehydratase/O-methyltransferase
MTHPVLPPYEPAAPPDPAQLPEAVQVLLLIAGKWTSQAVSVAATLGVADLLVDGPRSVEELAQATDTDARMLYRVLRSTAAVGVFAELPDGRITLTPLAEYLRDDVHGTMRHFAVLAGHDFTWRPYGHLVHALKTGDHPFEHVHGQRPFEYMEGHPELAAIFNNAMTAFTEASSGEIAADYDFTPFRLIADVGGCHGYLLGSILREYPGTTGLLFDQPHVVDGALPVLERLGVTERVRRVGGDFFSEIPAGADAYVLRAVLHDWSDDDSVAILTNVRRAMGANSEARLLIVETVVSPGNEWDFGKLLDLEMLVNVGGQERTKDEWHRLFERSGFELESVNETMPPQSILVGRPT